MEHLARRSNQWILNKLGTAVQRTDYNVIHQTNHYPPGFVNTRCLYSSRQRYLSSQHVGPEACCVTSERHQTLDTGIRNAR